MPRSVTKAALITAIPLLALALVSLLGSPQTPHKVATSGRALTTAQPVPTARVAFLHPGHPVLAGRLQPTPTPAPAVALAPTAKPPVVTRPKPTAKPAPPVSTVGGAPGVQFSLVNQDRAASGVAALAWSGSLARVAQYRAQDMLNRNYFSHTDPATGQLAFVQLLHLWGIPYSTAGENIAWSTNPSMAAINTMLMNSPEHRANILKAAYHRVGLGVATNGSKTMVVEVFSN
jgi:uncharacterized protein YkwD